MAEFKIGDVVQLKSGGPLMTVKYIQESPLVLTCIWFGESTERPVEYPFKPELLRGAMNPEPPMPLPMG